MIEFTPEDLAIKALGERNIDSPLDAYFREVGKTHAFYGDDARVLLDHNLATIRNTFESGAEPLCFEAAGPRRKIFFEPKETICAIVTCGGLCPGLNDVIRSIVMQAYYRYGVPRTLGIPYGFEGLIPDYGHKLINLTPGYVTNIHRFGGTLLGTSRGPQDTKRMVDQLIELKVNILFVVGGDGTQRGGRAIGEEALAARPQARGCRGPEDHRQRYGLHGQELRVRNGLRRRGRCHRRGTYRGAKRAEWHWLGQADGPSFWLHRLLGSHFQR